VSNPIGTGSVLAGSPEDEHPVNVATTAATATKAAREERRITIMPFVVNVNRKASANAFVHCHKLLVKPSRKKSLIIPATRRVFTRHEDDRNGE
jgi:hypothetical protein